MSPGYARWHFWLVWTSSTPKEAKKVKIPTLKKAGKPVIFMIVTTRKGSRAGKEVVVTTTHSGFEALGYIVITSWYDMSYMG